MSRVFKKKAPAASPRQEAAVAEAAQRAMDLIETAARGRGAASANEPLCAIRIGDVGIDLCGFASQSLTATDWYRPFVSSDPQRSAGALQVDVRLWPEPLPEVDPSYAIVSDVQGSLYRFVCSRFGLILDLSARRASVFLNHEDLEALDRSLRIAVSLYCLELRSVLVHSCGIKYREQGFLFVGQSGAGKSTLANLSDRYDVLSDETVLVDLSASRPLLHGTPFRGLSSRPHFRRDSVSLAAVLFLVQAPRNALCRLDAHEALRKLGSRAFIPGKAQSARIAALDLVAAAVGAVPAHSLEFTKDDRFLGLLDREFFPADAQHV
jgi:hypothetical protein